MQTNTTHVHAHRLQNGPNAARPTGRGDESDTADAVQSQLSVQSAPAVSLSRFVHIRLHLERNINRTPSFCHPFYLLIVVIAAAHMLGPADKKRKSYIRERWKP